jgi:hypothetical protein
MLGLRCQALVSLGPLSTPIKDLANGFPAQAVPRPKSGIRDFRMLVRIGDDFFVALANLFERESGMSHSWALWLIRP